jgi:peptidoglycan/xylan/chitin deacetylase (PgdA/CDA1 family)
MTPRLATGDAGRGPLARLTHAWVRGRLAVLAYHDVQDVDAFRRQMDYVRATMRPVTVDAVVEAQRGGLPLPPRAVLITFDDGDRTVHERAVPILRERGMPAVAFVITGVIGTELPTWFHETAELVRRGATLSGRSPGAPDAVVRSLKRVPDEERRRVIEELRASVGQAVSQRQLLPSELREMEAAGIAIGNHTHTHPCLDRCGDAAVVEELTRAHDALAGWLGRPPRVFAYPNGNGDGRAEAVLDRLGYQAAFLFDHRIGPIPATNPLRISRVRVNSTASMARFRGIVTGLLPLIHHARGRP